MDEYIKKSDIMAALEKERQVLLERGQYGAEHILVHSAINLIDELPVIEAMVSEPVSLFPPVPWHV